MFSSKVILVILAVLGLGGIGVAAASGAAQHPDVTAAQGTQITHNQNVTGDNSRAVPRVKNTSKTDVNTDLSVSKTGGGVKDDANKHDANVQSNLGVTIASTVTVTTANRPANAIALQFGVSVTEVMQLHNSGWGFGEIYELYELAKLTNKTVAEIQAMRDSGMGWGEIEATLSVKHSISGGNLGSIVSNRGGEGKGQQP